MQLFQHMYHVKKCLTQHIDDNHADFSLHSTDSALINSFKAKFSALMFSAFCYLYITFTHYGSEIFKENFSPLDFNLPNRFAQS